MSTSQDRDDTLDQVERRLETARENHMGHPYNLAFPAGWLARFSGYLINNHGDPYGGSHYAGEVCALEREVIAWFESLWECEDDAFWGSVGASGTESNLWAIYLGREALAGATLLHADEAHYSIPKAGRILNMATVSLRCTANGAISLAYLRDTLKRLRGRPVVLALSCATAMKGAHDDIQGAILTMDEAGYGSDRRFIHVDGALGAMVLPFVTDAPPSIRPSFRMAIDSLCASGHKMIGTPMPCSVHIARRKHVVRAASVISYLRSNDTTLMGSRNGHAVLAVWDRITSHGVEGYTADIAGCLSRADRFVSALRRLGVPVLRNPGVPHRALPRAVR